MNRNFATFSLIIWIIAFVVSGSSDLVGAAKAELAGKIFTVFFWVWVPLFILIALQALIKYGKENKNPLEKWR